MPIVNFNSQTTKTLFFLTTLLVVLLSFTYHLFLTSSARTSSASQNQQSQPIVQAYQTTQEPYLKAYEIPEKLTSQNIHKNLDPKNPPKGIIINHHFFGGQFMAEIIQTIKSNKSKTIVLIAPNHFFIGDGNIQMQPVKFNTPFGILSSDTKTMQKMDTITPTNYSKEHAITAIVGFIKKEIPKAKIIPITLKDSTSTEEINLLVEKLYKNLPTNALIIASLDFSHYIPLNYAEFQDQMAINSIQNFDLTRINKINIDSIPTLKALLQLMDLYGYQNFNLVRNSSSSILLQDYETIENTSYITGYFSKPITLQSKQSTESHINIFIGSQNYDSHPEPSRFFSGSDFTFLNYSDDEFNKISPFYNKYQLKQLEPFENNFFSINKGCHPTKFSIQIIQNQPQNQIEQLQNCLNISLTRDKDFDLGITFSPLTQTAVIYYLKNSNTAKLKTNLLFQDGIAKITF